MPLPEEAAEVTLRKETLEKILAQLSPRERRVLELRYGLNGEHPRTLDEVGRAFNVTRERIRQIENQSLKKLRALADSPEAPRRRVDARSARFVGEPLVPPRAPSLRDGSPGPAVAEPPEGTVTSAFSGFVSTVVSRARHVGRGDDRHPRGTRPTDRRPCR